MSISLYIKATVKAITTIELAKQIVIIMAATFLLEYGWSKRMIAASLILG